MNLPRWAISFGLLMSSVVAQDVRWSDVQWTASDDAPETLPVVKRLWRPPVPEALKPHQGPEYAEVRLFVPGRGEHTVLRMEGTAPWLDLFHVTTLRDAALQAARREGKPVASEITLHLIFNPATAAEKGPDATPRLLQVVPPAYPELRDRSNWIGEAVVEVDAEGRVQNVTPQGEAGPYAQPMVAAVRQWTFAPAREAGQAVAGRVTVPVLFAAPMTTPEGHVAPKVVAQTVPIYPIGMRMAGATGQVLVAFIVNVEGRVSEAFVVRSTQPGFDEAALDAVRRWKFEPAHVQGRPVAAQVQVPIVFGIEGEKAFVTKRPKSFPAGLPEVFHFDVPPDLRDLVLPNYPVEALEAGEHGKVQIAFVVDPQGRVSETRVKGDPPSAALAGAARAAVERFEFQPAAKGGKPSYALLAVELEFDRFGNKSHAPVTPEMQRVLRLLKARHQLARATDLDVPPKPVMRTAPRPPTSLTPGVKGEAMIEFVIDRQGLARLPRVISATPAEVGPAAALAVSQWRYQPPRRAGKPVDVLVRVPVVFDP